MVTIEKWNGPCGGRHGAAGMSPPSCGEEQHIIEDLQRVKALAPSKLALVYFNSNFDFQFYNFFTRVEAINGRLRDRNGNLCLLNNDGNFYLNVSFYDWSNSAVQRLWREQVTQWRDDGLNGIFSDHAAQIITSPTACSPTDHGCNASSTFHTMCNGGQREPDGSWSNVGRRCCEFGAEQADAVNAGHVRVLRDTQRLLGWSMLLMNHGNVSAPVTSVDSTIWGDLFDLPQTYNTRMQDNAGKGYVTQVRIPTAQSGGDAEPEHGAVARGACDQNGTMNYNQLALFLVSAAPQSYWACFQSQGGSTYNPARAYDTALPPWFPEYDRPLGAPLGPAVRKAATGMLQRTFASGTVATWDPATSTGSVVWGSAPL